MAICEHTPPPRPPRGGSIDTFADTFVWTTEIDHRRNIVGLLASRGRHDASRVSSALWLSPDDAETVGQALLAAVAAWRGTPAPAAAVLPAAAEFDIDHVKEFAKALASEMARQQGGCWSIHVEHPAGFTLFIARSGGES